MTLKAKNIPPSLISLLPMAAKWGIGDDCEREEAVKQAPYEELVTLVYSVDNISDADLYGWLSGPESFNAKPTEEYVSLTCLTMAIDSAKLKLKQMGKRR